MEKYSIGLDIGTNSVGWAVVDEKNQLVKKNGFTLWGVRMFDESSDASERRMYRSDRKRLNRRKNRIRLLREIFSEEINKVDPHFFERLDDSFYKLEDKKYNNVYNLFVGDYTDKDFFNKFPTIYHLRNHLINTNEKADIRFIYLALHNMIKYRGNFLYQGDIFNNSDNSKIIEIFNELNLLLVELQNEFEDFEEYFAQINLNDSIYEEFRKIMIEKTNITDKKKKLKTLFDVEKKTLINECIIPLIVGGKCNFSNLYPVKHFKYEKTEIEINCDDLDNKIDENRSKIPELSSLIDFTIRIKEVVNFYFLVKLLNNDQYISTAMIRKYDEHKEDLNKLKIFIKKYLPNKYDECFKMHKKDLNNYARYIGMNSSCGNTQRFKHCTKDNFYKYIQSLFKLVNNEDANDEIDYFSLKIENGDFLPRQNSNQNGSLPMQLNLLEMKSILDKQKEYWPFILAKDENGVSNYDKIISIFKFVIPYYVGPLNPNSSRSWIVRTSEKIYPWNFEKVVDIDETACKFIQNMQNKCTYLKGDNDYCLPKNSIIYSTYNCYSYLNKININGALITSKIKNDLFENVFLKIKKPSKKDIVNYLHSNYGEIVVKTSMLKELPEVSCNMSSYIKFKEILGEDIKDKIGLVERIIKDIVIFEDKKILAKRLRSVYHLDIEIIKKIKDLSYKGYGNLSNKLLDGMTITNLETGEVEGTVLDIMRKTNYNLQEILYAPEYKMIEMIDNYNKENIDGEENDSIEDFLNKHSLVSPIMKRALIQAYNIINEVRNILKCPIDKYYIECTRTNKSKKEEKKSRYNQLRELYDNCKSMALNLGVNFEKLNSELEKNQDKLKSDLLYLYFTQLGRCMYSLKPIDLNLLLTSNNIYDIDHIYPRALIKDDSISNRVLVLKEYNERKQDDLLFEIEDFLDDNAYSFYRKLYDLKLITKEKYNRLTKKEMRREELETFINRQIVSTNQAVKGLIQVLKLYDKVDSNDIIYSKAENISDARQMFNWPKSRLANNYHHAHDAYLNVVIGRVINKYFVYNNFVNLADYYRFKADKLTINIKTLLSKNRMINKKILWDKEEMVKLINNNLYHRYDVNETTRTYNSNKLLGKTTILPANEGTVPLKQYGVLSDITKYGGITSHSYSKYIILENINKKGEKEYILEAIPKMYEKQELIIQYLNKVGYDNFKIVCDNIRTKVVVEYNKQKFYISSRTNDRYNIINAHDRYFDKKNIETIKKIEKYNNNMVKDIPMIEEHNQIIISPSRGENIPICITKNDLIKLYNEIKKKFELDKYEYSIIKNIRKNMEIDIEQYSVTNLIILVSELLKLLQTNTMQTADLTLISMAKTVGSLNISKKLLPGMKFVSESVTGYYKKILFEVPR